jgi:hypothetical protein
MREPAVFQLAAATVQGRQHALLLRNNQDAFAWGERGGVLAAVVCDGCGSAPHSEVGAWLGARLAVEALLQNGLSLDAARAALLESLAPVARALGDDAAAHLLFTLVGAVVTAEEAVVFSCGDGLGWVDGATMLSGSDEAPPYLGYALLPGAPAGSAEFRVHWRSPATALARLALGTDGALELLAGDRLVALARDELVFQNLDGLRRRLVLLRRQGLFADDATLLLLRRAPGFDHARQRAPRPEERP